MDVIVLRVEEHLVFCVFYVQRTLVLNSRALLATLLHNVNTCLEGQHAVEVSESMQSLSD